MSSTTTRAQRTRRARPFGGFGVLEYLAVIVVALFFLFPAYWMIKGSFESANALLRGHLFFTELPTLENYRFLFQQAAFRHYFINSMLTSVLTTVLSTTLAVLAGYGLSGFAFRGKVAISRGVLVSYMFPTLAIAIPLFAIFQEARLTNTLAGLVLAHTTLSLPFGIWLMWQYFQTVPKSYRESAALLGAGRVRGFLEVELPIARPGVIAVAIFAFALSWEDYEFAFILTTDDLARTLPVGMMQFVSRDFIQWGAIMGAGVIMAIPALMLVSFLQRYLVAGLGSGGIKG